MKNKMEAGIAWREGSWMPMCEWNARDLDAPGLEEYEAELRRIHRLRERQAHEFDAADEGRDGGWE